jgi:hypothetical protein
MSAPKKQTAVQWLEKQFVKLETTIGVHGVMYELIEQAKAMEREQIVDAYEDGYSDSDNKLSFNKQYYIENYETI